MTGAVIKDVEDFQGSHRAFAEELLQPMTNRCDPSRTNMFASQIHQTVVLDNPEIPNFFSRFENKFGSYTSAIKIADRNYEIVAIYEKNALQKVYLLKDVDSDYYKLHFAKPVRHLTESYGYNLDQSFLDGAEPGDVIEKGSKYQGWPCSDKHGNFRYGVNLNIQFNSSRGKTYEDGIIASQSASRKLTSTNVEEIFVAINRNDLTVNTQGTPTHHKGFPDVGEEIQNGVLLARRRINHETILFDLSVSQLGNINYESDTPIYARGRVVDVDIFCNMPRTELEDHPYNRQILTYLDKWDEFTAWILQIREQIARADGTRNYCDDLAYWFRTCETSTDGVKWRYERTEFEGIVLKFTIAKSMPLRIGSKVTNRYGGKAVISEILADGDTPDEELEILNILPDDKMPKDEFGRPVDLVVNTLGVMNRLTSAAYASNGI